MASSWKSTRFAALAVALAVAIAGCGSSGDDTTSTATKTATDSASPAVKEAQAELDKLAPKGDPTIKVDPLSKPVPKGKTMTYITCPVPVCVEVAKGVKAASAAAGWKLKEVNEGLTPATIQSAFSSVAQQPTDAVAGVGILPNTAVKPQLSAIKKAGVPYVGVTSPSNPDDLMPVLISPGAQVARGGILQADWQVVDSNGEPAKSLYVYDPSSTAVAAALDAYKARIAELCPKCTVDTLKISSADIGSKIPSEVVSQLQRSPDVKYVQFGLGDYATGVPQAIAAAGLQKQVKLATRGASTTNMADIKSGGMAMGVTSEVRESGWAAVDALIRLVNGEKVTDTAPLGVNHLIEKDNLPANLSEFYQVPGYQETYKKAWGLSVLSGVSKRYPGQVALDDVDLEIREGEVHALVGQNGSGKSTLVKILAGYHEPEPGASASLAGKPIELGSGRPDGVRVIHQDLGLVDDMTVAENVMLEAPSAGRRLVSERHDEAVVRDLLASFDLDIDPRRLTGSLNAAARTMVAIVRALREGLDACSLLILDEPTAALPEHESEQLFALVRRLRDRGASVLFVSHRLPEVFALADRVTVLRDGKRVATVNVDTLDEAGLVELIVGRSLSTFYPDLPEVGDDVLLTVESLASGTLRDLSFTLRRGEIVGIAGLTGSGREVVAAALGGAVAWDAGQIVLDGSTYNRLDPLSAIRTGIAFVPADRRHLSATPELTVRENVTLPSLRTGPGRLLRIRGEKRDVADWLDRVDVRPRDTEAIFATLSGGNQQRAVLARWLRHGSRVFAIDEPTQGVDVSGKADIYRQLAVAAQDGAGVILVSTDVEELASVCDRVLVLRNGRVAAELADSALDPHSITHNTLVSR